MIPQMTPQQRMMAMRPIWHPPRWVAIDREAEIKADILEMQAGTRTLAQAAAERGQDWRSLLAQLAEEQDAAAKLGLSLTGFGSKSPSQSVTMPADTTQTPDVEDDTPADDEQADDVADDANDAEDEDAA